MEIYRKYFIVILCFAVLQAYGQEPDTNTDLYEFKLDYNVPESPAFSVLDANPTKVMRSNTGQELVVNLASSFIGGSGISPGLAVDLNPYYVLGGRLDNVKEYRENYGKRLLANTQLSFATIDSKVFPNDMLFSGGIKINLFDTKDMIFDKKLGVDIDKALAADIPDPVPGQPILEPKTLENALLETAYDNAKTRYMKAKGGSMSLGYAVAGRAKYNTFKTDSITTYRHQAWLVGQYDFGVSQLSLNGMVMYRYEQGNMLASEEGIISGIALRHYGKKLIISGEIIYEGLKKEIQLGGYIEAYLMKNISIYASLGRDESITDSGIIFKPGIKWNLSEPKKINMMEKQDKKVVAIIKSIAELKDQKRTKEQNKLIGFFKNQDTIIDADLVPMNKNVFKDVDIKTNYMKIGLDPKDWDLDAEGIPTDELNFSVSNLERLKSNLGENALSSIWIDPSFDD